MTGDAQRQWRWQFEKDLNSINLDIGIVGAGIAGLAAAASLTRCGHRVEVFERSQFKSEVGAALGISPNVAGVLRAIGFDYERARGMIIKQIRIYDGPSLNEIYRADWAHVPESYGWEWYAFHRVDLHEELKQLALNPPIGIEPAKISLGKQVESVDCEAGIIRFANGEEVKKDVIVGADGIHSSVAKSVLGDALPPIKFSGQSTFRCLIPTKALYENETTNAVFREPDWEPDIIMKIATIKDRRIVYYPCRNGELFNIVALHPTAADDSCDEGWHEKADIEDLCKTFETFHISLLKGFQYAEDVKIWKLQYRDPIPTWSKGKAIILGDAAHPMLPHHAQAANMALEDVGAFSMLLSNLKSKDQVLQRLQLLQEIRGNRTTALQIMSSFPQDSMPREVKERVEGFLDGREMPRNSVEFADYIFGYDLLGAIRRKMESEAA